MSMKTEGFLSFTRSYSYMGSLGLARPAQLTSSLDEVGLSSYFLTHILLIVCTPMAISVDIRVNHEETVGIQTHTVYWPVKVLKSYFCTVGNRSLVHQT